MAADLGGEVGVETKPLEMDTENFRKTNDTHLLEAVLKADREKGRERVREEEGESLKLSGHCRGIESDNYVTALL